MTKFIEIEVPDESVSKPQGSSVDDQIAKLTTRYSELEQEEKTAIDMLWMRDDAKLAAERYRIHQEKWRTREQIAALNSSRRADDTVIRGGQYFSGSNG